MYFCIRDDDTSFFTSPDELERAYGQVTKYGPISLAIIPFCRAGMSRGLPEKYRGLWSIHPLEENTALVQYLRHGIANGRYEAMLHGYHHDEPDTKREFIGGSDLRRKVREGKRYLEDLLHTRIRVFVPPHNAIGRSGLEAITREGLHLGGVAGVRSPGILTGRNKIMKPVLWAALCGVVVASGLAGCGSDDPAPAENTAGAGGSGGAGGAGGAGGV